MEISEALDATTGTVKCRLSFSLAALGRSCANAPS